MKPEELRVGSFVSIKYFGSPTRYLAQITSVGAKSFRAIKLEALGGVVEIEHSFFPVPISDPDADPGDMHPSVLDAMWVVSESEVRHYVAAQKREWDEWVEKKKAALDNASRALSWSRESAKSYRTKVDKIIERAYKKARSAAR